VGVRTSHRSNGDHVTQWSASSMQPVPCCNISVPSTGSRTKLSRWVRVKESSPMMGVGEPGSSGTWYLGHLPRGHVPLLRQPSGGQGVNIVEEECSACFSSVC
jgi:hypothetical protein